MNRERLELLKEALELHQKETDAPRFNMNMWACLPKTEVEKVEKCTNEIREAYEDEYGLRDEEECGIVPPNVCATAACALGTGALYPPLFDQGLRLIFTTNNIDETLVAAPYFNGYFDFRAGAEFFDITESAAEFLFEPGNYFTDCMVVIGNNSIKYLIKYLYETTEELKVDENNELIITETDVIRRINWLLEKNDV